MTLSFHHSGKWGLCNRILCILTFLVSAASVGLTCIASGGCRFMKTQQLSRTGRVVSTVSFGLWSYHMPPASSSSESDPSVYSAWWGCTSWGSTIQGDGSTILYLMDEHLRTAKAVSVLVVIMSVSVFFSVLVMRCWTRKMNSIVVRVSAGVCFALSVMTSFYYYVSEGCSISHWRCFLLAHCM
jgi:hypothetical protein